MNGCLGKFIDSMNRERLPWLVWCGCDHIETALDGSGDLDVLVESSAIQRTEQLLKENGFVRGLPSVWKHSPNTEFWYGCDPEKEKLIFIHLHRQMEKEGFGKRRRVFLPIREAVERRVFRDGMYIQDPSLEALLVLCQTAAGDIPGEKKLLSKREYLLQNFNKTDIETVLGKLNIPVPSDTLRDMLLRLPEKPELSPDISRLYVLQREDLISPFVRRHKRLLARLSPFRLNKKRLSPRGVTIALAGQDGAGKTTVSGELEKWLGKHFAVFCRYMGCGSGRDSMRKRMLRRFPEKRGVFVDTVWWIIRSREAVAVAARAERLLKKAEKDASYGCITILDRMPQTSFSGYNDGPKLRVKAENELPRGLRRSIVLRYAAREERLLARAVRHPADYVLLLTLSPEESVRRKPENRLEVIEKKRELLAKTEFAAGEVVEIDAQRSFSDEMSEIKSIIWEKIRFISDEI